MSRYLIVSHQTALSPDLQRQVSALVADDPAAEFAVLVPEAPGATFTWEGETVDVARHRAEAAKTVLEERAGARVVRTAVGASEPLQAITDELRMHPGYDTLVICTLPPGVSRWLKLDLVHRAERKFGLRVIHVVAEASAHPRPQRGPATLGRQADKPLRAQEGAERWHITGEYLENCNCQVLCPCLLGPRGPRGGALARPTEGICDVPLVFRVESGEYGKTRLDGTHAALVVHTPGPMGGGNWTAGLYVDERATAEQRQALEAIFRGRAGGVMAVVAGFVSTWLPTRVAAITFGRDGRRRWAAIPGVLDVELEGLEGRDGKSEVWLENVRHFVAPRLAAATATRSSYKDHAFAWNNTGRNGHYAAFEWTGG